MAEPVLILFAKKPQAGKVKTRLCPPLPAEQAMNVANFLLEQSIINACKYWPGEIEVSIWPDLNDAKINRLAARYDFNLSIQSEGDLGSKMSAAIKDKVFQKQAALIMGCDVPQCPDHVFKKAYQKLNENINIIAATQDGGYYLVGLNQYHSTMFNNINWGSTDAYQQTLCSCRNVGIEFYSDFDELVDLDDYDDLLSISTYCASLNQFKLA